MSWLVWWLVALAPRRGQGYSTSHGTCLVSSPESIIIQTADLIPESLFSFLSMFVFSHMGFCRDDLHLAMIQLKRPLSEAEPDLELSTSQAELFFVCYSASDICCSWEMDRNDYSTDLARLVCTGLLPRISNISFQSVREGKLVTRVQQSHLLLT